MTTGEHKSDFDLTKCILTGELWRVYCGKFGNNLRCYNNVTTPEPYQRELAADIGDL